MMHSTWLGAFGSALLQAATPPSFAASSAAPPVAAPASPPPPLAAASPAAPLTPSGLVVPSAAPEDAPVPAAPTTEALLASAATKNRPVLPLDAAEHTAIEHQPSIRQARFATAAAVGRVQEARSGYLPQVIGSASWTYGTESSHGSSVSTGTSSTTGTGTGTTGTGSTGTGSTGTGSTGTSGTTVVNTGTTATAGSSYVGQLAATQLIYDFGQTTEKWKAASRSVESLQATETTTTNQILYNVRSAFFTARADRALVHVQAETLANEQKHLVQTEGFVRAGTQPEISLAQTRTDLANAKVQLITAENNYDIARAQLNLAMGVTTDVDYDVADRGLGPVEGEDDPSEVLVSRALSRRPELASLVKTHEADVLTIRGLRGGYAPSISGLAGAGWFGSDITNLSPGWEIGLTLSWPLLLGGLTHGQINEAQGNLGVVDAQLEAERLQVRLDVEQARLTLRSAKVSIGATEEALVNAREQLRLAEASYAQGVGNIIQLGDAQVAETAAGAQRVQADFNLAIARAQLLLALGHP